MEEGSGLQVCGRCQGRVYEVLEFLSPTVTTSKPKSYIKLPRDPKVVPFWGSYIESYKVTPKKELLWGLWVNPRP